MKNSLKRITVTFILISLIPVGFVIYELSSLNTNEKMVSEAYRNQLDAILYSINQYTDDVFSSWANKIDILLLYPSIFDDSVTNAKFAVEFSQMSALGEVYFTDLDSQNYVFRVDTTMDSKVDYEKILNSLDKRLKRLATYQRGGYRKIEALDTLVADRFVPVYFLMKEDVTKYKVAILLVDLHLFIQNVLAPKMQAVSQGKFIISAFNVRNDSLIYSTEDIHPGETITANVSSKENTDEVTNKELWLLPGYYLGISLKDASIGDLVRERLITSVVIFTVLFVMLVIGIIFLYRNIRKEIMLSQAKSEFVSNVSHEIRTPLSLISMYAETLEMNRVPEERKREYYAIISKETMRLAGIVNCILNFAQMDANKKKYEFKTINLNELTSAVVESYAPHLKEKGFSLEVILGEGDMRIKADGASVSEALVNLMDNAVKYSRQNKNITVRTGIEAGSVFVEVEDRGIGIAKVYQNHIFEQFFRVPTHNVHTAKGTGLGLTLVKKTMLAHKGKVNVQSALDKGSTFRLTFPSAVMIKNSNNFASHEV